MLKDIQYQISTIIINIIVIILGSIISIIGTYIINFVKLKNDELIKNIGITKYISYKSLALDVWNIVDEYFRANKSINNSFDNKIKMFNSKLQNKCPGLTEEDIDFLRQTIAGEINKYKSD